jgi:5-formaminoimidazole-4-carboxamide-1-(beta)-D-ribofuranosyl 5'-monophosphate synthetase
MSDEDSLSSNRKFNVHEILAKYDIDNITIGTICSHSALQIFYGAKQEGFRTIGITKSEVKDFYDAFPKASPDEYIIVRDYREILKPKIQNRLINENVIVIPHGSFIEYVGANAIQQSFHVPLFGNKASLIWESNRDKLRHWIQDSGLRFPKEYSTADKIEGLAIAKLSGAKGGKGYFLVRKGEKVPEGYTLQEYVVGVRYYPHFFYTPLSRKGLRAGEGSIELLSIDKRIESNIDEIYRLGMTTDELEKCGITPSFVVTGNMPVIVREALLPKLAMMGRKIVESSVKLFYPGIIGPFCLETICTPDLEFIIFEISARIVAGTNLYITGSPYTPYLYDEPMSMAQRIAREIRIALEKGMLEKVVS